MNQNDQALKVALAAVEQLSPQLKRKVKEHLLASEVPDRSVTLVYLKRLSPEKQSRLQVLMDKNNEGQLTSNERREVKRLGAEVDRIMLENSRTLAYAVRPELFDERGRRIKKSSSRAENRISLGHAKPTHKVRPT